MQQAEQIPELLCEDEYCEVCRRHDVFNAPRWGQESLKDWHAKEVLGARCQVTNASKQFSRNAELAECLKVDDVWVPDVKCANADWAMIMAKVLWPKENKVNSFAYALRMERSREVVLMQETGVWIERRSEKEVVLGVIPDVVTTVRQSFLSPQLHKEMRADMFTILIPPLQKLSTDISEYRFTALHPITKVHAEIRHVQEFPDGYEGWLWADDLSAMAVKPRGTVELFFMPGQEMGFDADWNTGKVSGVHVDTTAHKEGVKRGWVIKKIDDAAYNLRILERKLAGQFYFKVTFNEDICFVVDGLWVSKATEEKINIEEGVASFQDGRTFKVTRGHDGVPFMGGWYLVEHMGENLTWRRGQQIATWTRKYLSY